MRKLTIIQNQSGIQCQFCQIFICILSFKILISCFFAPTPKACKDVLTVDRQRPHIIFPQLKRCVRKLTIIQNQSGIQCQFCQIFICILSFKILISCFFAPTPKACKDVLTVDRQRPHTDIPNSSNPGGDEYQDTHNTGRPVGCPWAAASESIGDCVCIERWGEEEEREWGR